MQPQVCKPYILNKTLVVKSEQCLFPLLFHHMIKSHKPKTHKFFFQSNFFHRFTFHSSNMANLTGSAVFFTFADVHKFSFWYGLISYTAHRTHTANFSLSS